jgi:thiol-disulfide isomerase/thioredoxin
MALTRCLLIIIAGMTFAGFAPAEEPPSPAARLAAIRKEVADAETAFQAAWAKVGYSNTDDPGVEKLYQAFDKKQKAGFATAWEIAKADPKSAVGFDALEWLLTTPRAHSSPAGIPALQLMAEHHAANPKVGKAVAIVAYYRGYYLDPKHRFVVKLLNAVAQKNPDRTARGQAVLGLAWQAKDTFSVAEAKGAPETDRLAQEAEKSFEAVVKEYGDCPNLRSMGARPASATLADEAKTELYELRHLRIGKPAPEVEGRDLDGAAFKLGDCRGKVTLLVFWASWCGPCMGDVPHERELVEQFKGRPFVLVGVNGDGKLGDAKKAVETAKINWRSFWNGDEGPGGPIAVSWNVRGWPTVYVIDHKGIIRHKSLRGTRLDEPLGKLVAEAEKDGRK